MLNRLNLSKFKGFTNKDLQDRFSFELKIEQIVVLIVDLDKLGVTFRVWYENRRGRPVNVVVWF